MIITFPIVKMIRRLMIFGIVKPTIMKDIKIHDDGSIRHGIVNGFRVNVIMLHGEKDWRKTGCDVY